MFQYFHLELFLKLENHQVAVPNFPEIRFEVEYLVIQEYSVLGAQLFDDFFYY